MTGDAASHGELPDHSRAELENSGTNGRDVSQGAALVSPVAPRAVVTQSLHRSAGVQDACARVAVDLVVADADCGNGGRSNNSVVVHHHDATCDVRHRAYRPARGNSCG